ncbi:threonine aldolase family protein [Singulisphaera acidiphila]|uniref:L-threonine aldolase n=1 Tax=Singulisphaera acidiphila (strain ATCC BAA-1392 / DSM 18658 / VKM B-2454 / MOB10) TaxID=886293 RepID=L0D794_SINAD|nr:low specificity L-threonine aldolase [Singulisphaera acidiphila]AGA24491.1 threonine aldolase [Singulisphaera acidiphila DSM 18658]
MGGGISSTADRHQFASDNYAGACPEAWQAMAEANRGHAPAYGDDDWTTRASGLLRDLFEVDCEVFFVFNGTAANALALASLCQSYHGIICHELAHVETDECGAPEFFSNGTKLLLAHGEAGRVNPDAIHQLVTKRSDIHYPKPRVLSLTQATEVGTVYSVAQLEALQEMAQRHGLRIHMDGARFSNAVAAAGVTPKELTWKVGVDVLCFGGTKIGMAFGEAIVFFNRELAHEFAYRCKQAGQLASKMRFLAAQWVGILESGAWLRNAEQANRCALLLESRLREIPGLEILWDCEANAVFVMIPEEIRDRLRAKGWRFYTFIGGGARLMCSWDTTEADVEAIVQDIKELMNQR